MKRQEGKRQHNPETILMKPFPTTYLGDGVYASFDGYHVLLHVGRHDTLPCVALEPDVIAALNQYYAMIVKEFGNAPERTDTV
jgi:hypothetical protein